MGPVDNKRVGTACKKLGSILNGTSVSSESRRRTKNEQVGYIYKLADGGKLELAAVDHHQLRHSYASGTVSTAAVRVEAEKSSIPTFIMFGYIGALPFLINCL